MLSPQAIAVQTLLAGMNPTWQLVCLSHAQVDQQQHRNTLTQHASMLRMRFQD